MSFRRALIPIFVALVFLVQFVPGSSLGPHPAAAMVTCTNLAQFVADVTIPDGTTVTPGSTFTKTWRLQNAGTCTWSTSYAVQFVSGTNMAASQTLPIPASVAPGATVDITTTMTAPSAPGHYRGNYEMKNDTGGLFGVGASASFLFWVDINVGTTLSSAYDFAANASSATWTSGAGALTFPGTDGDVKGFALADASPKLENGTTSSSAGIIVNPQQVTGGFIQGKYPAFTVQAGDHFQSIVDCTFNATSCYVNFRLAYQVGSGPVNTLWSFNERREGLFFRVNVDLSSLAGQSVNFILYTADVPSHGVPSGDRAEWVGPMIARGGSGGTPIPPPSTCNLGSFVGDVTIPDGTIMAPGQAFTKTWRVRNIGSCAWDSTYDLVFVFGNGGTFGAAPITGFSPATVSVLPVTAGQTADFSLNMVAPTIPGHYRSYWRFQNGSGTQFGVGSGMVTFFADINVSATAPTVTPGGPGIATPTQNITGPSADLSVTVNDGVNVYNPGGTVTYTITVMNNGPFAVTGATLVDHKPSPHVTSWTWTCVADTGASCTAGPNTSSADVSDTNVNLPVGKKVVYTVVATVNPSAVGNLVNAVTITNPAAVPDPNLANNSATDTDAPPSTNLTVTMADNVDFYTLGGTVVYTINMINSGPLGVTGATFTDPIPNQIQTWTWACTTTGGAVWSGPGTTTANVSTTVNMPAGSTISCTVTATVKTTVVGNITNTATLLSPLSVPDSVPADNSAFTTITGPNADLVITKDDGVAYYTPGGTLTYTVTVKNNGPLIVNNATITDNMPTQITGWTWACTPDTGATCANLTPNAAPFTDTVSIPNGFKVVYTVTATVGAGATGSIVNTATVQNPASIPDLTPANNTATDTDLPPSADLQITQNNDFTDVYIPGGTLTYTIDVYNAGPQNVIDAAFTDVKPTQIASWTWSCAPTTTAIVSCNTGPSTTTGDFSDTISIPKGVTIRYSVIATLNTTTTGDLVNTASVALSLPTSVPTTDPNLANNSRSDTDRHPTANLSVSIVDNVTKYIPGTASNYTITVTNSGPDKATNAVFTAIWPVGTSTSQAVLSGWTWTCVASLGSSCTPLSTPAPGVNFTDTVTIAPGGSVTYTLVANVLTTATENIPLAVSITSGAAPYDVVDPDASFNTASDTNFMGP